ncbi:hypothetical protein CRUP_015151, partial [Coryphaenoides rupestris]
REFREAGSTGLGFGGGATGGVQGVESRARLQGLGTNEETLMEILSTRPAPQVKDAQTAYSEHNVVAVVQSDIEALSASLDTKKTDPAVWINILTSRDTEHLNRDFAKLVVALLHKDNVVAVVQSDIEALSASLDAKKTDPAVWINILTSRDTEHLNRVLVGLELQRGEALEKILDKRFSGDVRMGLKIL